jgi:hypothetical protein
MTSRIGIIEWMTNTNVLKDLILSSMSPEELHSFRSNKENANPQVIPLAFVFLGLTVEGFPHELDPEVRGQQGMAAGLLS